MVPAPTADAYKNADGRKVENRRVVVDVERGRTVPNWRPRRLAGGLGGTRMGGKDRNVVVSGRDLGTSIPDDPNRPKEEPRDRERDEKDRRDREREREREREGHRDRRAGGLPHLLSLSLLAPLLAPRPPARAQGSLRD